MADLTKQDVKDLQKSVIVAGVKLNEAMLEFTKVVEANREFLLKAMGVYDNPIVDTLIYIYLYRCPHCHGPAFYLKEKPNPGDPILSDDVIKNDGTKPKMGERIICGSCGVHLAAGLSFSNILPVQ